MTVRPVDPRPDPAVLGDIRRASAATGVDFRYLVAQAAQESGFRADAKAATSSARGLYQFVDQTWLDTVRRSGSRHGLGDLASRITLENGRNRVDDPEVRRRILDLRDDPKVSAAMAAELARSNADELRRATGRAPSSADLYLAHFLGAGGASAFLRMVREDGATPAADILPEAAAANRSVFYGRDGSPKSVAEVYREISAKIDRAVAAAPGGAPAGGSAALAVIRPAGGMPASIPLAQDPTRSMISLLDRTRTAPDVLRTLDLLTSSALRILDARAGAGHARPAPARGDAQA